MQYEMPLNYIMQNLKLNAMSLPMLGAITDDDYLG